MRSSSDVVAVPIGGSARRIRRAAALVATCTVTTTSLAVAFHARPSHAASAFSCQGVVNPPVVGMAATRDGQGYWEVDVHGGVRSCGDALVETGLAPDSTTTVTAIASNPAVDGFWLVTSRGKVVPFGQAVAFGDASGLTLTKGIVAMAPTPDGRGYWLLGGDGGVFSYGDAGFFGSTGDIVLNRPAVGMVSTGDARGYWFVASDGGIFAYGDAGFFGSTGNMTLNKPVVGMTPSVDGNGYRMVASDGGVFSFGDAPFFGSSGGSSFLPVVGMAPTPDGQGYWTVDSGGDVFSFGNAGAVSSTTTAVTTPSTTGTTQAPTTTTASTTTTTVVVSAQTDPTAIPIGDGHLSTSPVVGSVDSCQTSFSGGGAEATGPWFDAANGTWNSETKIAVQGSVSWPTASYSVTTSGTSRVVSTNDLPTGHTSGTFPIARSDPAFQYDTNPNTISAQPTTWNLPLDPSPAPAPSCVTMGAIGILDDGVLLFNALDAEGRDAGAHEILDAYGEHPEMTGALHHHEVPAFLVDQATGPSTLVGYAVDGYGIYVERDANGNLLTNANLDACHGRTSTVMWNGKEQDVYHYDATLEYPYTVGCFHGVAIKTHNQ